MYQFLKKTSCSPGDFVNKRISFIIIVFTDLIIEKTALRHFNKMLKRNCSPYWWSNSIAKLDKNDTMQNILYTNCVMIDIKY